MLTLIDTFCVGRADGTLALAALAVNCGALATQR
jgi:Na+-driven multidrug efflux pump